MSRSSPETESAMRSFDTTGTILRRVGNVLTINCEGPDVADRVVDQLRTPPAGVAPTPAALQMHSDLRRLAIAQRHVMAHGGATVHVGYACKVCRGEWDRDAQEFHAATCTAVADTSTLLPACSRCEGKGYITKPGPHDGWHTASCPACTGSVSASSPDRTSK